MQSDSGNRYDVAVIGAGVAGASVFHALTAFHLKVILLEKCEDVSFGVSRANSGIIHAGFHHEPGTLKARLEVRGNAMFDELHRRLHFPFSRPGILVAAFSPEELKTVRVLFERGVQNGVEGLELLSAERMMEMEPVLNTDVIGGMYAPSGGIIEPYRFVFALVEAGLADGGELITGFDAVQVCKKNDLFEIASKDGRKIHASFAVNAAGLFADEVSALFGGEQFTIRPRKGEEFLLRKGASGMPRHVLFPVPSRLTKGTLVIPTVEGTMMVGPTAEDITDKNDLSTSSANLELVFSRAVQMVPSISRKDIITSFAGLRPVLEGEDFFIKMSDTCTGLLQIVGIQSPGLTAAPAIGEYACTLLENAGLRTGQSKKERAVLPPPRLARTADTETLDHYTAEDPAFGRIICRCEHVSEAEIINAVRLGHKTVNGVKFYTRAGMGKCQGGFCMYHVIKLIAQTAGIPMTKVSLRGEGSELIFSILGASE